MKKHLLLGGIFILLAAFSAFSQNTAPSPPKTPQTPTDKQTENKPDEENSDLVITANVRARELKFEVVPNPTVEFSGKPERQTVWESDRENLPEKVEPGVTYRNIGIRLRIYSRFAEIQKIVLEAIDAEQAGDTPAENQNPPPSNAQNTAQTEQTREPKKPLAKRPKK